MSTLETSIDRMDGIFGRLMTALERDSFDEHEFETMTACYIKADDELNEAVSRESVIPLHLKPKVEKLHRLHMLVKHTMQCTLDTTSAKIGKVRASRKALGQQSHAEFIGLGSTGIDCNLRG